MYIEVSGSLAAGSKARLVSPRYPATQGSCLQFWYHMYGSTIGTLNVYVRYFSWSMKNVWSKTGNYTNIWNVAQVTISASFSYQVRHASVIVIMVAMVVMVVVVVVIMMMIMMMVVILLMMAIMIIEMTMVSMVMMMR